METACTRKQTIRKDILLGYRLQEVFSQVHTDIPDIHGPGEAAGKQLAYEPGLCSRVVERRGAGVDLAEDGVHPGAF